MPDITNTTDILNSRDIIARIEDLECDRAGLIEDVEDTPIGPARDAARVALGDWDDHEGEELKALKALAEQAEGYGDWEYGETLIHRDYFVTYTEELAEDIGAVNRDAAWPLQHIDWEAAARELEADYMTIDFDGAEYLMRA